MPIFPSEPESTLDMITNFDIRASCILAFWAALPRRHFSIRVTYIIPHGELAYLFPLMNWGEFYFDLHLLFLDMGVYCKTILLGTSINFEFGSSRDCFFLAYIHHHWYRAREMELFWTTCGSCSTGLENRLHIFC
jgi:hypothetical protein